MTIMASALIQWVTRTHSGWMTRPSGCFVRELDVTAALVAIPFSYQKSARATDQFRVTKA
jgi:hypothetical protein